MYDSTEIRTKSRVLFFCIKAVFVYLCLHHSCLALYFSLQYNLINPDQLESIQFNGNLCKLENNVKIEKNSCLYVKYKCLKFKFNLNCLHNIWQKYYKLQVGYCTVLFRSETGWGLMLLEVLSISSEQQDLAFLSALTVSSAMFPAFSIVTTTF